MKRNLLNFSRGYQKALRKHLKEGNPSGLESARGLHDQAEVGVAVRVRTPSRAVTPWRPDCKPSIWRSFTSRSW